MKYKVEYLFAEDIWYVSACLPESVFCTKFGLKPGNATNMNKCQAKKYAKLKQERNRTPYRVVPM